MAKGSRGLNKTIEELKVIRQPINEKCKRMITEKDEEKLHICSRSDGEMCNVYAFPSAKWRNGDCPMADAILRSVIEEEKIEKVRVGQQKQKKKK